jgi:hypothetical protein
MTEYNEERPHQGRYCFGKTPMQTFLDARTIAKEKQMGERNVSTTLRQPAFEFKLGFPAFGLAG